MAGPDRAVRETSEAQRSVVGRNGQSPRGMPTHGEGRPFVETCSVPPPSSLRAMPESPPSGRCQPPGPTAVTPLSRKPGLSGCDASGVDV